MSGGLCPYTTKYSSFHSCHSCQYLKFEWKGQYTNEQARLFSFPPKYCLDVDADIETVSRFKEYRNIEYLRGILQWTHWWLGVMTWLSSACMMNFWLLLYSLVRAYRTCTSRLYVSITLLHAIKLSILTNTLIAYHKYNCFYRCYIHLVLIVIHLGTPIYCSAYEQCYTGED